MQLVNSPADHTKDLLRRVLLHGLFGLVLGYALLHPLSFAIYNRTMIDAIEQPEQLSSAFSFQHVRMAAYFAVIGLVFGIVHGLDRHRNIVLYRKVRQLSVTDPLTGLHNRRFFMQSLRREHARAKRYGNDLSLIMIDIDHFKQFNDAHGHPAGDVLLRSFATRMRRVARSTDVVARVGGEEFMILMPDTNLPMAAHLAERLRKDIENYPFEHRATQPDGRITVSIGCAQLDRNSESDMDHLLRTVDDCLYRAKNCGRNQISF
jgi:diguanylate cyclase (GGDEF)-like protein